MELAFSKYSESSFASSHPVEHTRIHHSLAFVHNEQSNHHPSDKHHRLSARLYRLEIGVSTTSQLILSIISAVYQPYTSTTILIPHRNTDRSESRGASVLLSTISTSQGRHYQLQKIALGGNNPNHSTATLPY